MFIEREAFFDHRREFWSSRCRTVESWLFIQLFSFKPILLTGWLLQKMCVFGVVHAPPGWHGTSGRDGIQGCGVGRVAAHEGA
ncbi:MAG: hypothetical protein KJ548_14835, partial [Actinobacteria bacterium]|nr:hypothetical protein [Actinomycetota bacterium]